MWFLLKNWKLTSLCAFFAFLAYYLWNSSTTHTSIADIYQPKNATMSCDGMRSVIYFVNWVCPRLRPYIALLLQQRS